MWAKIDDQILDNPKIAGLSPEAKLTYFAAIVYSKQHMTDGVVAEALLPIVVCKAHPSYVPHANAIAEELVAADLWEPSPLGWATHDWLDWNLSADEIRKRAAASKERKRRHAERQRDASRDASGTVEEREGNANATLARRGRDALATTISHIPYPISDTESLTTFDSLAATELEKSSPPPHERASPATDLATQQASAGPARRSRAPAKQPKARAPDPVWDALEQCEPVTNDAERGARNKACQLLRQSLDKAAVTGYDNRFAAVLELWDRYPDAMPAGNVRTANALARNVGRVLNHAAGRNTPRQEQPAGYGVVG